MFVLGLIIGIIIGSIGGIFTISLCKAASTYDIENNVKEKD